MRRDFEVIFYGTEAVGDERDNVIRRVRQILKISDRQANSLFKKADGTRLYRTSDERRAKRLVRKMNKAGALTRFVDARSVRSPAPHDSTTVYDCTDCKFTMQLGDDTARPVTCPACGIDGAKSDALAQQKRARIRSAILADEKTDPSPGATPQASNHSPPQGTRRMATAGTIALGILLGASGGIVADRYISASSADTGHPPTEPQTTEVTRAAGTSSIDIARQLTVEFEEAANRIEDKTDDSAEPASIEPAGEEPIADNWQHGEDALDALRLGKLSLRLFEAGRTDKAIDVAGWIDSPRQRLGTLLQLVDGARTDTNERSAERFRQRLRNALERDIGGDPAQSAELKLMLALALNHLTSAHDNDEARMLALINDADNSAEQRVRLFTLCAEFAAHVNDASASTRWLVRSDNTITAVMGTDARLAALHWMARAHHVAGETRTARHLIEQLRTIHDTLVGPDQRARHQALLVDSYVQTQQVDAALDLLTTTRESTLGDNLDRARLAIGLAASNQTTSARGVLTTITHPAALSRALARVSSVAELDGQIDDARAFADAAIERIRTLPSELVPLLASELAQPIPDDLSASLDPDHALPLLGDGPERDAWLRIIATNLAWRRIGSTARQWSLHIDDEALRSQTQRHIDRLGVAFDAAASNSLVLSAR